MGTPASLLDLIAHGGSLRASQDNAAQLAQTQHTQAQIPLIEQQALQAQQATQTSKLQNQITQQQLQDQEIQRQIFAEAGRNSRSAVDETGSPLPSVVRGGAGAPAPRIATPPFNPNAPAANAPVVPNYLSDPRSLAAEMARRGASAQGVLGAFQGITTLRENFNKLSKGDLDLEKEQHGLVADSLQGYLNTPDAQKPQAYAQFYQDAVSREPNLKSELPAPGGAPSQDDLAHVIGKVHLFGTLLDQAEKKSKTAETDALASQNKLDTAIKQYKFDLMRNPDPIASSASIDGIIDPAKYPEQNKMAKAISAAEMKASGDPEKASQAVQKVADDIRDIQKKDLEIPIKVKEQAAMIPGEVNKQSALMPGAVREAAAKANAEIGAHVAAAVQTHRALAKLSPDAFAGIANPTSQNSAMKEADTIYKEYTDKSIGTQQLLDNIKAEQAGNKAAGAAITIEQARSLIQNGRLNAQELKLVSSGAGNLIDSIEGKIKGIAGTDHIPSDVIKDIAKLATISQQAAKRSFDAGLDRLKMRGVDTTKLPEPKISSGSPSHQAGDVVQIGGKRIKISAIHPDGTFDGAEVK